MKTKVALVLLLIISLFVAGFFVSNKKSMAKFLEKESSKPIKSFEEYSQTVSLKERIAIFNKELPRNKSLLWRQNLIYHADRINLNPEQKIWVEEADDFMDENFFAIAGGDESEFIKTDLGKSYEKLMIRKSELFTKEQGRKFCSIIGDESTLINSERESKVSADDPFTCNCAGSWFCTECPMDEECSRAYCSATSGGCGCGNIWNCTKKCTVGLP